MSSLDLNLAGTLRHLLRLAADTLTQLFTAQPLLFTVCAAALLLVGTRRWWPNLRTTDPRRMFTAAQKERARLLAGGRCEMDGILLTRCRRDGEHADHWIPWTRGGATSETNLVWACRRHNLRKSSRQPSWWQTARITRRRAGYFPAGARRAPGERYRPPVPQVEASRG